MPLRLSLLDKSPDRPALVDLDGAVALDVVDVGQRERGDGVARGMETDERREINVKEGVAIHHQHPLRLDQVGGEL
jgi:hypothetical protein